MAITQVGYTRFAPPSLGKSAKGNFIDSANAHPGRMLANSATISSQRSIHE